MHAISTRLESLDCASLIDHAYIVSRQIGLARLLRQQLLTLGDNKPVRSLEEAPTERFGAFCLFIPQLKYFCSFQNTNILSKHPHIYLASQEKTILEITKDLRNPCAATIRIPKKWINATQTI